MRTYLLVGGGAAAGATARWFVGELLPRSDSGFPWATLAVNLGGCLLAGLALRTLTPGSSRWLFAVTGVLGGLTTYSSFAVETRDLITAGRPAVALTYVGLSVTGGIAAVEAGRFGRAAPR